MTGTFMNAFFNGMAVLGKGRSKRISSYDRSGGNEDFIVIGPGETAVLAVVNGAGCINKTYATVDMPDRLWARKLALRMFWDGEKKSSVEVPFGDFYGVSNCIHRYFSSLLLSVNPGAFTVGYNSYFHMPYGNGFRIEVTNESEFTIPHFWYHIDYEEWDEIDNTLGRFHAQFRRENPTRGMPQPPGLWTGKNLSGAENYVILEASGKGNFVGIVLNVDNITGGWWGEGDDMIFIDGEKWAPSIHGTGTEEIFGGGACPNREYAGLYSGFHLISNPNWCGKNGMYRFYVTDPIHFQESIKVTLEHGHNNDLSNDYSSIAYWYQEEPHQSFPTFPNVEQRLPIMPEVFWEAARKEIQAKDTLQQKHMENATPDIQAEINTLQIELNKAFDAQRYETADDLLNKLLIAIMKI